MNLNKLQNIIVFIIILNNLQISLEKPLINMASEPLKFDKKKFPMFKITNNCPYI